MSCAKKTSWRAGSYDDIREGLRTLRSGRVKRIYTPRCDRFQSNPRSTIDNALRDAFRTVIGFDPLYERNPAWKFPRQIDYGVADA